MNITEIALGPLVIPLRLAIPMFALLVSVLLVRWLPLGPTDTRRYAVDVVLGAIFAFFVGWKLTPVFVLWESVVRDPRVALFAPGGTAGIVIGCIAAIAYGVLRVRRDGAVWAELGPYLGLFAATAVMLTVGSSVTIRAVSSASATEPPPSRIQLSTLDGRTVVLGEPSDVPRLVNFWATWCVPCRSETQVKRALADRHQGSIEVIGVNLTASESSIRDVRDFVDEWGVTYTTALDPDGRAASLFSIRGTPTSLLFDADGNLVDRFFGALSDASAMRFIQPVLAR